MRHRLRLDISLVLFPKALLFLSGCSHFFLFSSRREYAQRDTHNIRAFAIDVDIAASRAKPF